MILPSGFSTYDYSIRPNLKGWGQGWPVCSSGPATTIVMERSGTRITQVHAGVSELFEILLNECERRGYLLVPGWCWGGACRPIGDGDTPSNHSWKIAVDINAPKNPYNALGVHDIPDWMFALFRAYGFGCGADYTGRRKDYMHFEFMGTPADAAVMTSLARRAFVTAVRERQDPPPAPAPAVVSAPSDVLRAGASGPRVRDLQWRLSVWGLIEASGIDGDFGPKTEAAVKTFQVRRGLDVDGVVGPKTWEALNRDPIPYPGTLVRSGSTGIAVRSVQDRLIERGLLPGGSSDGKFGPKTEAAVRSFQKSRGLLADGIVGPATWKALHS